MTYVKQALGTNGENGITLGPGIDPNMGSFSKELMMEQGPFVFFTFDQIHKAGLLPLMTGYNTDEPDVRLFIAWFTAYDHHGIAYISKVMLLHDTPIDKPKWVADKTVRFKQADYDLYKASMQRVSKISASQGLTEADPMDHALFMDWWKKHDAAGWAAATVIAETNKVRYQVPAQLFGFWKSNDQGNLAPPGSLLGLGLWATMKRNWLWIGAGVVGGGAAYKLLQRRRERKVLEISAGSAATGIPAEWEEPSSKSKTMLPNCPSCK